MPIHLEDIRSKLTTPGFVLEGLVKSQSFSSHLIKLAMKDFNEIEKELSLFGLNDKLTRIKKVLESLSELKQPTQELVKQAVEDYEHIVKTLDGFSSRPQN